MKRLHNTVVFLWIVILVLELAIPAAAASKSVTGTIVRDDIIFRAKASQSSDIILRFKKGDKVTVTGISGSFYEVTYKKKHGYVMCKFVNVSAADVKLLKGKQTTQKKTEASDPMKGITRISQITVPATSKKGDSGTKVTALQQALTLKKYYTGKINGKFGADTRKAVLAFQKAKGLKQTGEADEVTIKALFGKKPPNASYTTEQLDWFKGGGATLIPRGATFTVKDVLTGKTFKCRRLYGAYHMDTEPLNKAQTEILRKIYGGSWSWNRRAVLVLYKGHVYAGSMNGMPHGNCSIKNNDFDGHFCIHFSGSMTHGSKKVDPGHQNAVKRALRSKW